MCENIAKCFTVAAQFEACRLKMLEAPAIVRDLCRCLLFQVQSRRFQFHLMQELLLSSVPTLLRHLHAWSRLFEAFESFMNEIELHGTSR